MFDSVITSLVAGVRTLIKKLSYQLNDQAFWTSPVRSTVSKTKCKKLFICLTYRFPWGLSLLSLSSLSDTKGRVVVP